MEKKKKRKLGLSDLMEKKNKVFIIHLLKESLMTASSQTSKIIKQSIISLLVFMLLLEFATATLTTQRENDADAAITLVDVSVGATEDESACIFKVNGNTVVVNRHQTETSDGVTIYVQEVYATNAQAQDQDRCKFLYSIAGQTTAKESAVQQEIIGEQTVNFLLGTRADLEAENAAQTAEAGSEENAKETDITANAINDNTVVKINGYDVTGLDAGVKTETSQTQANTETAKSTESLGIVARIFQFLFG